MKKAIYILTLGLLGCNSQTEKNAEAKLSDSIATILNKPWQTDTLHLLSTDQKLKESGKLKSNREFPFDSWLSLIQDKDSISQFKLQIDSMKYINLSSQPSNTNISFSSTDKWKLANFVIEGWDSPFPNERIDYFDCFFPKDSKYMLTSTDIFEIFGLSDKEIPLKNFPFIINRNSRWNGKWTAILPNEKYLIVCLVDSYPDGNQTSYIHQRLYFFKKVVE